MKKLKFLLSGLALVAISMPAIAQKAAPAPKKLTSVEGITEYSLSNGMRVLLFPDASKPTITVNITYKVGSRMEGYGETGMAHLLEHMVFKGSTKHPNVPEELNRHGASFNGTTYYDRTNYYETFNASDENLNWALDLESDRMINSFIAEKDLKSEYSVVRNEFEIGENNPSSILMERVLSTAYLWHNYGKSTIGSKDDIEKVPIKNLQAFYKKYYQPDNAVLMIAGKIDEAKTLELVNKYFGNIPRPARVLDKTYTVEPTQDGERHVELRRAGDVQNYGCMYHIPSGAHPDYAAMDVLNEVLTDEPTGRIYQAVVKTGKASSISSYNAGLHDAGFLYMDATVPQDKSLAEARKAFESTITDIKTKPITKEEVDKAKTKLLKSFDKVFRNSASVGIITSEFIGMGDWRLGFIYRDQVKKVTANEVNAVANKYLIASNRTTGEFIPTANAVRAEIPANPDIEAMVKDYKGEKAMAQGEAFDASPANIDSRTVTGKMLNGAKFALLSKETRGNVVDARITLRIGDEGSLRGKSAIADLTADMLRKGTQNKNFAQINEALDKLSSTVTISGSGQNVVVAINSTKANMPATMELVDEMLHRPSFPLDEFKTLKAENISGLEEQRSEPQALAGIEFGRALNSFPKGHILYSPTIEESIEEYKKADLEDVKKFYNDYYNGSSATVAIVGDFDQDKTKEQLEKILGNWSAIKPYTRIDQPYTKVPVVNKNLNTPDKKNAMMLAGMLLKMNDTNPDYPALTMGDYMFGGGALNSRLAGRIRQKEGISYAVGSFFNAGSLDDKGVFGAYAMYNPENKDKVESAYKDELKRIIDEGFTQEELDAAKKGLLANRQRGRANDAALAAALSNNLFLGRTMAFSQKEDEAIEKVTLAEVNAAVKKYFDPAMISFIMAGDFKADKK